MKVGATDAARPEDGWASEEEGEREDEREGEEGEEGEDEEGAAGDGSLDERKKDQKDDWAADD